MISKITVSLQEKYLIMKIRQKCIYQMEWTAG